MTDRKDEFYQPWLRDAPAPIAPVKRRSDSVPALTDTGLSRDEAPSVGAPSLGAPPLGVDIARYPAKAGVLPSPTIAERIKPAAAALRSGAVRSWAATLRGAQTFADWTIHVGERADVPARVAALEIPRRSGVAAQRTGALLGKAGGAVVAATGQAGRTAGRALGKAGNTAQSGLSRAVTHSKAAGARQIKKLRPPAPDDSPPESGLDRLLAATPAAAPKKSNMDSLPLFSTAPTAAAAGPATAAGTATAEPDTSAAPRIILPDDASAVERADERAASLPRVAIPGAREGATAIPGWLPWAAAALALLALTFWLGSRWGGSAMTDADLTAKIREVITTNPEIVPQALEQHRANQMAQAIADVRPILEKPFAGAWIGNATGDVTLTIFTDYACVYCRAALPDIDRLVREDKGVKVVFRELPIIAPQSKDAAVAALAAARQGRYDAFHHAMFAAPSLDRSAIDAASTRAGVITGGRSDAVVYTRLFEREIDNNLALAQQLGVDATPTMVIGSQMLAGAVGIEALKKAVAEARAAS